MDAIRRRPTWIEGTLLALLSVASTALNADLDAPPRFDGAGYAVLAESLRTGRGYREIDRPDAPLHAHFPPGYPLLLAGVWRRAGGPSMPAAYGLSIACTVGAVLLAWAWFRRVGRPGMAFLLAAALAINWQWARTGGSIQSEPPFLLVQMAALLTSRGAIRAGWRRGIGLGLLLGTGILTRHVGIATAAAIGLDLLIRRRTGLLAITTMSAAAVVAPWAAWLATVREGTQLGLVPRSGLAEVVALQGLFYLRRIPDQILGPVIEVGTVFRPAFALPATVAAAVGTGLIGWGWLRSLRSSRRRLAGLLPLTTLALLLVWPFTEAGRFLIPLVPFLLVGAADGLATLLARWAGRRARALAAVAVLAASIPYPAYVLIAGRTEAARAGHGDFDAACRWIATEGDRPGPVLTRQGGEAFWRMDRTRHALDTPPDATPEAIDRLIDRFGVAYLIIDDDRYAASAASPLGRYAEARPDRVAEVWARGSVRVEAVEGNGQIIRTAR